MARTTKNVLGNQSGRIGQVVGMVNDGVQLYRSYTDRIINPRTPKQQMARAKLSELSLVSRAFKTACSMGLKFIRKPLENIQNVFIRLNKSNISGDAPAEVVVDYTQLTIAKGNLPMPGFGSARADEALQVDVTWVPNDDIPGTSASDKVYIHLFQPDTKTGITSEGMNRSAGSAAVMVPSGWSGMRAHVYGFAIADADVFDNNGTKIISANEPTETAYLGQVTIV